MSLISRKARTLWLLACFVFLVHELAALAGAETLDEQLRRMPTSQLVEQARKEGDAGRGAIVFFQPHMACAKCHSVSDDKQNTLGPNLAQLGREASDESIVESILLPSRAIRNGYKSVTVLTTEGKSIAGLLAERMGEKISVREIDRNGELTTIPATDVEAINENAASIMPAGQMNQLSSRQQFLDLVRYLIEIRDGGAERAKQLQPAPTLLAFTLPEYEQHLNHAALIGNWNRESLERGEAIYRRVCANCHGTKDAPGSLPTSLRFAEGRFKNGSDPFAMYQTLTRGFGFMAPQSWMVPSQKYDVIHYIREAYLRVNNPTQFASVDKAYLAGLPEGDTLGPEPSRIEPWSAMDYGPTLAHTYETRGAAHNFAYKGIGVRLDGGAGGVSRGREWMLFDTDTLRVAAAWSADATAGQNFIDWRGVQFNGEHNIHPHVVGKVAYANSTGPGWSNPGTGDFRDNLRTLGRDGRQYGPLPKEWAKYRGLYHNGQQAVLSYTVGKTDVLESPGLLERDGAVEPPLFLRTFNVGPRTRELVLQVAQHEVEQGEFEFVDSKDKSVIALRSTRAVSGTGSLLAGVAPRDTPVEWKTDAGNLRLRIPAGDQPLRFTVWTASPTPNDEAHTLEYLRSRVSDLVIAEPNRDLSALTHGGPPRWPEKLETDAVVGADDGPLAVDILTPPDANPWLAQTRFTGLDFFPDGRMAVCSWDGDVWIVEMAEDAPRQAQFKKLTLQWQRIASGLFQPLGLKIVDGKIHLTCRDQLCVLHDLNGDGETDFYQCLNNDHQVTEHFHEFAMGLQTDTEGNFYYAKSARHALPAVVPHHGTLLRVSKDGARTDILANGFRAANGVCLNPDGSFVVTDQEGHWNPKNRINWVTLDPSGKPKFYGNMFGYHDVTDASDAAMQPPLCWITNAFDRSPAELLWVTSDRWEPLKGSLLNLSYGYGKVFVVPHENVNGVVQGGMVELSIPAFPTGVMRGRFHPADGQLYLCGMFAWAGSVTQPGGLYRVRATGKPIQVPIGLSASRSKLKLTFTEPLAADAIDPKSVHVKSWSLKRTANYGSDHYDEKQLAIRDVAVHDKTVTLEIPDLQPTWCMEIKYAIKIGNGPPVTQVIHNTIHRLAD